MAKLFHCSPSDLNLHSSMERLKVFFVKTLDFILYNLHSSMERLKVITQRQNVSKDYNLHSSMERLKGL